MVAVELDEDLVRDVAERGRGADRGGEDDGPVVVDVGGLEDGPGELAEEAVAHVLRQHAQVHVEEAGLAGVDALAQVRVGLVGRAPRNGVGARQFAVQRRAGGGAGDDADLERPAGIVLRLRPAGDGLGDDLGGASGGKAAEADRLAMLDERRGFIGREHGEGEARCFGMGGGRHGRLGSENLAEQFDPVRRQHAHAAGGSAARAGCRGHRRRRGAR